MIKPLTGWNHGIFVGSNSVLASKDTQVVDPQAARKQAEEAKLQAERDVQWPGDVENRWKSVSWSGLKDGGFPNVHHIVWEPLTSHSWWTILGMVQSLMLRNVRLPRLLTQQLEQTLEESLGIGHLDGGSQDWEWKFRESSVFLVHALVQPQKKTDSDVFSCFLFSKKPYKNKKTSHLSSHLSHLPLPLGCKRPSPVWRPRPRRSKSWRNAWRSCRTAAVVSKHGKRDRLVVLPVKHQKKAGKHGKKFDPSFSGTDCFFRMVSKPIGWTCLHWTDNVKSHSWV